jgi:hypothetical protein
MPADPNLARIPRCTLRQAKRAYAKRSGKSQLSEAERRRIDRLKELDRRAEAIRQKEDRKRKSDAAKLDREAKEREERKKRVKAEGDAGSKQQVPNDENDWFSSSQPRLAAFWKVTRTAGPAADTAVGPGVNVAKRG